jgi:hypothetical protein
LYEEKRNHKVAINMRDRAKGLGFSGMNADQALG